MNTGSETWNSSDTKKGFGTNVTYYGPYGKSYLKESLRSPRTATFKCPNINDLYTINGATKGNKAMTYPIGLITADEPVYI